MTAVACLRVLVDENRTDVPAEALGPLVAKYANIFLEVRWTFPRISQQLNHYSYLLTDPMATELDTVELGHLSQELQLRLFGTGIEDAVKLALFEGPPEAIEAFAAYSRDEVLAALDDPSGLPASARLRRIAADGSLIDVPETPTSLPAAEAFRFGPTVDGAQGIYFPAGGAFIGDGVSCTPVGTPAHYSIMDGEDHRPPDARSFDAACILTTIRFLIDFPAKTPLYVPVSFSSLVRPGQRAEWLQLAAALPGSMRQRLAASIYDVPRAPTFQALSTIRAALDPHFAFLDLCVRDPDFQIEHLTERAVASVTFVVPDGRPDIRFAALRRFASQSAYYRKRRIPAGATNLRTRAELDLAIELRIPFLSGPGVCRLQEEPIGGQAWPVRLLPLSSGEDQAAIATASGAP